MSNSTELTRILTEKNLKRFADRLSFLRGKNYAAGGRVEELSVTGGRLTAVVRGTSRYRVELDVGEELVHQCSCPVGRRGVFCKHCVAVGLAWLNSTGDGGQAKVSSDEVRDYLLKQDVAKLTELMMTYAADDPGFRQFLSLRVLLCRPQGVDPELVRRVITDNTIIHWRLYGSSFQGSARKLRQAYEMIGIMADAGQTKDALELARFAIERLGRFADSTGYRDKAALNSYQEALDLHLTLCHHAELDVMELARWVFKLMTGGEYCPGIRLEDYIPLLGIEGLTEFRRLAVEAWEKVPVIRPNQYIKADEAQRRRRFASVLLAIGDFTNNRNYYLMVWERDLSHVSQFLNIVREHVLAGRHEDAIKWAEHGLKSFPGMLSRNLRSMLVDEYLAVGRTTDALNTVWKEFADFPCGETEYLELKRVAEQAGQWPVWREEALELLRVWASGDSVDESEMPYGLGRKRFADRLVMIQLAEGDIESAWRAGCSMELSEPVMVVLAQARAKARPLDAAVMLCDVADRLASEKNRRSYGTAKKLLLRAARFYKRARMQEDFKAYLAGFREKHKRKWILMRLLDEARWP